MFPAWQTREVGLAKHGTPVIMGTVGGLQTRFLVDTGATVSTIGKLNGRVPPLSHRTLSTLGFSGTNPTPNPLM